MERNYSEYLSERQDIRIKHLEFLSDTNGEEVDYFFLSDYKKRKLVDMIQRYKGDVENPKGGVRHSIIEKGYY